MSKHQENIKYLIQRPKTPVIKPPMHRSIYNKSLKREFNLNRSCHQTMGYAEVQLNRPSEFLKKQTRKKTLLEQRLSEIPSGAVRRTPINRRAPSPKTKTTRNFLRENIVDVIRSVPPLAKHRQQDSRNGHVLVLDEAGLEPTYACKKGFGTTPRYIGNILKEKETARLAEVERIRAIRPPFRRLSGNETNELLTGMKTNWDELQKQFLLLPMVTDSVVKINRKTLLENQLENLEKHIDLLEKYPTLYVCDNA